MPTTFAKLNFKDERELVVLDAPASFEPELKARSKVQIIRNLDAVDSVQFALAFVTKKSQLDRSSKALIRKASGDAVLWFAYPKASSKRYGCDFNRDNGWEGIRASGWDSVTQIAIDTDWSALRFRRLEFITRRT